MLSSVTTGQTMEVVFYKDADYTNWGRKTDFTYKYGGKSYRVWLDKNKAFPFGLDNMKNWRTCNTGRSPCDGPIISSGGECCYKVSAKFSGTECMRMDVCCNIFTQCSYQLIMSHSNT
ncbi:unnamed protein product [Mucor hiemalis]